MCQQELTERRVSNMKDTKKEVMYMTDKQFLKVLKQIKLYAEECNDAQNCSWEKTILRNCRQHACSSSE